MLRLPVELFEEEDLRELRRRSRSALIPEKGLISFSNTELRVLDGMFKEGITNNQPNGSATTSVLLKAVSFILTAAPKVKTIADSAALLTAALQIASIDPQLGTRVINLIKIPSGK